MNRKCRGLGVCIHRVQRNRLMKGVSESERDGRVDQILQFYSHLMYDKIIQSIL
jgi:hypothetical protein